jgi:hypothetical protein
MKHKRFLITFLATLILLSACAGEADYYGDSAESAPVLAFDKAVEEEYYSDDEAGTGVTNSSTVRTSLALEPTQERLIIRTGRMNIIVEKTEDTLAAIDSLAGSIGGWVVNSNAYDRGGAKAGSITIRIPAERFDSVIEEVRELAIEVTSESTDSQDVTEEFVDLSARLGNLEATAQRVRSFLDEAKNVEEALAVNEQLLWLEGDIEALKGRIKYLQESAAFSSLTIDITPDELSQPIDVAGWQPKGVAKDAIEALIEGLQTLANVAIWLGIYCLPFGLLLGIPGYFLVRFIYRRLRRRRQAQNTGDDGEDATEEVEVVDPRE